MSWAVPVLLRIAAAYVVGPLLAKPLVDTYPQRTVVLLQFAGCLAVALPLALALQQLHSDWRIVAVGFGNGLAAYCYYKAITISLSRTALFAFWDDLLAMGLSYGLLHEGQFLNTRLLLGMGLSVGAVIGFTFHSAHHQPASAPAATRTPRRLYLYAGTYSLLVLPSPDARRRSPPSRGGTWCAWGASVLSPSSRSVRPSWHTGWRRKRWCNRCFWWGKWWPRPSFGSMCSLNGRPSIAGKSAILAWGSLVASWWP
jgi:hypothetical protein